MLTPSQVLPFLLNPKPMIRALALRYLSKASDPSPATCEDLWRMIDQHGPGEFNGAYLALSDLPHTEASLQTTLERLSTTTDDDIRHQLQNAIADVSYGLLLRCRDTIEQNEAVPGSVREHIARRIELAQVPRDELLDRLIAHAEKISADDYKSSDRFEDHRVAERLIEALARHPESASWAISTLNDPAITDWREIYAADLLGQMRFRPAAETLVDSLMSDEDADFLIESCTDALVRVGSPDVVRIISERWSKLSWGIKLHAGDVLSRIKLPQSEAAALSALNRETDRSIRTRLAGALCELCATDEAALARLRDIVNAGTWEKSFLNLDEDAAALFMMLGKELPEMQRWEARIADTEARRAERMKEMSKLFRGGKAASRRASAEQPEWDEPVPPWEASQLDQPTRQTEAPVEVTMPIKRNMPKVGRNDSCPCGSGKKFKKCCGK